MDYAKAAGANNDNGMYYNDQMIYCVKRDFEDKELMDKLDELGYWKKVKGFQRCDLNRKICLVIYEEHIRNHLVENGVELEARHVNFYFHRERNSNVRVLVSQLPIGIKERDLSLQFRHHGVVLNVRGVNRTYRGNTYDTGERVLTFQKLVHHIPSYVKINGYLAYVKYNGQPATCRMCGETGHLAADCHRNPRRRRKAQEKKKEEEEVPKNSGNPDKEPEVVNMDIHEQPPPNEPDPENPGEPENHDNEPASEKSLDKLVTLEDCQTPSSLESETLQEGQESGKQGQAWADSPEGDITSVGSEKPQEEKDAFSEPASPGTVQRQIFGTDTELSEDEPTSVTSIWGDDDAQNSKESTVRKPTTYCPQCRRNSHSEEECVAAVLRQANEKVLSTRDSKKGEHGSSRGKTFKAFMDDLDHVVMRGEHGGGLDYVLGLDDRDNVCALYLLCTYGGFGQGPDREVQMSGGKDVVDLWRRHSREGLDKEKAEELLHKVHGRFQRFVCLSSGCGPSPEFAEVRMYFSKLSRWTGTFPCLYKGVPRFSASFV